MFNHYAFQPSLNKSALCPTLRALSADEADSEVTIASGLPEWRKTEDVHLVWLLIASHDI
jgi:hypothetical protein